MLAYLFRLDDAHDRMNINNWNRIFDIFDKYHIKPIISVIPDNKDEEINFLKYRIKNFWDMVVNWKNKGYLIALHGLNHLKNTTSFGIVPKNDRSEFSGLSFEIQEKKIFEGLNILKSHSITTDIWVAPFHSFDNITIHILKKYNFKYISDGISFYPYYEHGLLWIPQQYNYLKNKKFGIWTICLHPSEMKDEDFIELEKFIKTNYEYVKYDFMDLIEEFKDRKKSLYDVIFHIYFFIRRRLYKIKEKFKNG